jgi:tricorn protease
LLSLALSTALAQTSPGYFRDPALFADTLVFTAEGDLWRVPVTGGVATRLTTHQGVERRASFSPDGAWIAFDATYEGPQEVYVMPASGGLPTRLTYEGGTARGWTPDGQVVVSSRRDSGLPDARLVTLHPTTFARDVVPLAQADEGAWIGADSLIFTRLPFQGSWTKRYTGGYIQQLWRYDGAGEARPLFDDDVTSRQPAAWGDRVVFVSDRDGTLDVWSSKADGSDPRQHTKHEGFDVMGTSVSGGKVAYQLGADVRVHDLTTGDDRVVPIQLLSDFDQTRERWITNPSSYLTAAHPSPTGDRVALTARGHVFVAPHEDGTRLVQVTRDDGVRWRDARFIGDGTSLVAWSDQDGELAVWKLPADGLSEPTRVTSATKAFQGGLVPSPDGKWIAWTDRDWKLWVADTATGKTTQIEANPVDEPSGLTWSPDSRWLAYASPAANTFPQIRLVRPSDGVKADVTSDRWWSTEPAWTPDGTWLYFTSERALASDVGSPWGPFQPEPYLNETTRIYAVPMKAGTLSPWVPRNELQPEAKPPEDQEPEKKERPRKKRKAEAEPAPALQIDLTDMASRTLRVPIPEGNIGDLILTGDALFWLQRDGKELNLMAAPISDRPPKPVKVVGDVARVELTKDGKSLLVEKGGTLHLIDAKPSAVSDLGEKKYNLAGWALPVDPRTEWKQMLAEAWRLERDWFYDPGLHGNDWDEVLARHLPLVDRLTDRDELADLMAQMVGELSALHIFVRPGDARRGDENVGVASLGAHLTRDEAAGGWKIADIYTYDPEVPEERPPLAVAGVDAREGDVIVKIDGEPTLGVPDPMALLRGKAGRPVRLELRRAGAKVETIVTPVSLGRDADLRYRGWELERRERVEAASNGDFGYLHLRAMGGGDYESFAREFYPAFDRKGLIVDVRHNRGGNIDSWILEKLMRKAWMYWQARSGVPSWNMQYAFRGHIVVLTDQHTASDGEAFAEGFKRLGLGDVIGERTWGGGIWLTSSNTLRDGGIATAAEFGVFGPEGEWIIEGSGMDPTIEVDNLPAATFGGGDAQLDAAIAHLKALLASDPIEVPTPPPGRDLSRDAWTVPD